MSSNQVIAVLDYRYFGWNFFKDAGSDLAVKGLLHFDIDEFWIARNNNMFIWEPVNYFPFIASGTKVLITTKL